jgi:hypothetical protein
VHRSGRDRLASLIHTHSVRRYRCRTKECGWQGLLDRPRTASSLWASLLRSPPFWFVAGMLSTLLVVLLVQVYWVIEAAQPVPVDALERQLEPLPVEPGVSMAGKPLDRDDARRNADGPLTESQRGCVWGGPGQHPYLGTLADALAAARLPGDIVGKLATMHGSGLVSDRLELSSAGIRSASHRRHFGYTAKAMALDRSVCFNTRINLAVGAVGAADLYELVDGDDQRYTIMVARPGANVAVLEEQTER